MKKVARTCKMQWSAVRDRVRRATKRSVKFIRSLRAFFLLDADLRQFTAYLRQLYARL